jgi:hypothetical protein
VPDHLVTGLLPVLGRPLALGFNVFDVLHHGTHEKQISNLFRWLLDTDDTHRLGDRFQRIFLGELNLIQHGQPDLALDGYWVHQEVNTSVAGDPGDIADLVLESGAAVVVVENYLTSDGHGHSYDSYLQYSQRDGRHGVVVLLCRDEDGSLQTAGWENAAVLTYAALVRRLHDEVVTDRNYQLQNPESYSFIEQMYRKFVKGRGRMEDQDVLDFVVAMCDTGEAGRYQERPQDLAADRFANDLAEQARERFGEGRELMHRVKARLRSFGTEVLGPQLNATLGDGFVRKVSATYSGIYQWTINFEASDDGTDFGEARLQLKFGPSAWFANEKDPNWTNTVEPGLADYSRVFITRAKNREIRQSAVTLQEVLDGLAPADLRLHDEIVRLLSND